MGGILKGLKKVWLLNAARRFWLACKYFNKKYIQIGKWVLNSKEDTNFTYEITDQNKLYIANSIAIVTHKPVKEILNYMEEAENDKELEAAILSKAKTAKYTDQKVLFGRRLGWYAFVRATKPKVVIETGIDKGLGSMILCSALLRNSAEGVKGKYYGTDINPEAGFLLSGKYKEFGEILFGDSIESLKQFSEPIDLFINDSDHSADYELKEYQAIESKLSKDGIILGDNSHCTDKLAKYSLAHERKFIFIGEEPKNHWYPGAGMGISYV